ncbi:MAG: ubiquinol-cytochrome c reductase iron-sulfur subunit [Cyanobacteria bacterium P01_F01_bin.150]
MTVKDKKAKCKTLQRHESPTFQPDITPAPKFKVVTMKRRPLLRYLTLGAIASSLPIALAACHGSSDSTNKADNTDNINDTDQIDSVKLDSEPREDGFAAVGTVAQLDREGFLLERASAAGMLLVIRNPQDTSSLLAVVPFCTHQGCIVDWENSIGVFVCPCHDTRFNPDGTVASGPAQAPLSTFETMIEGDLILVRAAT